MVSVTLGARAITTTDPDIAVTNQLAVGVHKVQLVVEDNSGNQSDPIAAQITILGSTPIPIPIPRPIPIPSPIPSPGPVVTPIPAPAPRAVPDPAPSPEPGTTPTPPTTPIRKP